MLFPQDRDKDLARIKSILQKHTILFWKEGRKDLVKIKSYHENRMEKQHQKIEKKVTILPFNGIQR